MIYRVMPEHLTTLWPQFEAILTPALVLIGTHDAEDVRRMAITGRVQVWAQINEATVEAAVITEFVDYPKGLFIRAWLAGARREAAMDDDGFYAVMDQWRHQNGAAGFEAIGRHGWLKRFPTAKVEGLIMRIWA